MRHFKFLGDHVREIGTLAAISCGLILVISFLGSDAVRDMPVLGLAASILAMLLGGVLKYIFVSFCAWFFTIVTFQEVAVHVWGVEYDVWWLSRDKDTKSKISLAVIMWQGLLAALCMIEITVNAA